MPQATTYPCNEALHGAKLLKALAFRAKKYLDGNIIFREY
jgi:hypothetical protein